MKAIRAAILDELDSIDLHFIDGDDTAGFALQAGYRYPLVKVSNTVINASELEQFDLHIGGQYKLPTVSCSIADTQSKFRGTDCIDESTVLTVFIGSVRCELEPTKLTFAVTDCQVISDSIYIAAELDLPSNRVSIYNDTVSAMLEQLCKLTGLGLRLAIGDFADVHVQTNYTNVSITELLDDLCDRLGFSWHIDGQYNICINDLSALLAEHTELTVTQQFDNYDDLAEPKQARISSKSPDYTAALPFTRFGYDYVDNDNTVPNLTEAVFDKSFDIGNANELVAEGELSSKHAEQDLARLYIEFGNNPLLLYDRTYRIDVYTEASEFRRQSYEDWSANKAVQQDQQFIEDLSGIYKLDEIRYVYPGDVAGFDCKCSFVQPSDNHQ